MNNKTDTIAAIATPPGTGGVGVIRVSGPAATTIAKIVTGKTLQPRYAHYARFRNDKGETVDHGVAICFNAPHSYTGEDVVEFQGHGGVYVLQSVLQTVLAAGARQARPGEFTERAFLNDKMDLLQAEAVADLIESRSQSATTAALRSLSGQFSTVIDELQAAVIALRVYVEAALDFSEEDIDFLSDGKIESEIAALSEKVDATLKTADYGKLLHDGVQIVLVGEPNAGKSSLMNCLLGHERAIVTEEAGTTRDTLAETLTIRGIPVTITDTAGLREAENTVEQVGIERAKAAAAAADLVIWLRDGRRVQDTVHPAELNNVDYLPIDNKADLYTPDADSPILTISAKTGQGIDDLIAAIADKVTDKHSEEGVFSARERHINALTVTQNHIKAAKNFMQSLATAELVAEELRLAQHALSEITGEYRSDDLLGAVFSSFCVGK